MEFGVKQWRYDGIWGKIRGRITDGNRCNEKSNGGIGIGGIKTSGNNWWRNSGMGIPGNPRADDQ